MKQLTLANEFAVEGKGLHTGLMAHARFIPAPAGHGYKFQRVDLPERPIVDALAENVVETCRGTVIARGEARVSTIEHAMAALYAAGIDNVLIEIDGPEMPILDGSARPFAKLIAEAGLKELEADKNFWVIKRKTVVTDEATGATITALPDDEFSVDVMVGYDSPVLQNQYAKLETLAEFPEEIAPSRTFVFVHEIQPLLENNLIKGGDLDNAVVIYDRPLDQAKLDALADAAGVGRHDAAALGYLNSEPLRHDNEPARHKLMDLIGDLALIGMPLKGKIIAFHPGHKINTTFAKQLRREVKHQEMQAPAYDPSAAPIMDNNRIRELLPHRYPMLLVDKVIAITDQSIVGVKCVTTNEPFFQGHFPQEPVMPGVLMVEAMAQTGGLLVLGNLEEPERYSTYFMKIDNVKFRQKVVPGDTLKFHVSFLTPMRRGCAIMKGYAFVGDKIVCECEFMAQVIKNK